MLLIQRINPYILIGNRKFISFVGGGGKTSWIEFLASEALRHGKSVAIATTTKIYAKEPYVLIEETGAGDLAGKRFVRTGWNLAEGKLTGLTAEAIREVGEHFDLVLIEADGAKGCPLKFPATHEPVIPSFTEMTFIITGLDGLHGKVEDVLFRWELFSKNLPVSGRQPVTGEIYLKLFVPEALLKGVRRDGSSIAVLNKYDTLRNRGEALFLARKVLETTGIGAVFISSVPDRIFYRVTNLN